MEQLLGNALVKSPAFTGGFFDCAAVIFSNRDFAVDYTFDMFYNVFNVAACATKLKKESE